MTDYRAVADIIAAEIGLGKLAPGHRLPPQRTFAYERGIAVSTASRVYSELARRGLVIGEVGRGTFVRAPETLRSVAIEAADMPIDLQVATAMSLEQATLLAPLLQRLSGPAALYGALGALGPFGPKGVAETIAPFIAYKHWSPDPASILFSSGGRQAIATAVAAICKPGDRIGVEPLTFPSIMRTAAQLGLQLVPIPVDDEGIDIAALHKIHRAKPLAALYIQPSIHNPLGITMKAARREALAKALHKLKLLCVEDTVYAFLSDATPLAAYAPECVIAIDSMQKRIGAGTGLGFVVAPPQIKDRVAAAMRAGGWVASSLAIHQGAAWISSGVAAKVADLKRKDAKARQELAADLLGITPRPGARNAFHIWLELPEHWRADTFAAAAAVRGVAITPASTFAVMPGHAPNVVRIAITMPQLKDLQRGLEILRALLRSGPHAADIE